MTGRSHDVRSELDVEYVSVAGTALRLDLHRPTRTGSTPCVVYFHGGGWMRGHRSDALAERLLPVVRAGVAVATVSYRFSDVATFPAQLDDARAAVRWVRASGERYGLRTSRVGVWGASAGGTLAMLLATADGDDPEVDVQAACAFFPVTDLNTVTPDRDAEGLPLPSFVPTPLPEPSMEARLFGVADIADARAGGQLASPVAQVGPQGPPVLLLHGDRDGLVSLRQSRRLHQALTDAGRDADLLIVADADHEDAAFHSPPALAAVAGFFAHHLAGSLPAPPERSPT